MNNQSNIVGAVDWLVQGVPGADTPPAILNGLCSRLVQEGLPIDRAAVFVKTLHPTVMGRRFLWERDGEVETSEAPYDVLLTTDYRQSPAAYVINTGEPIRCRLAQGDDRRDFQILHDLACEGFTDYAIEPLTFTTGDHHAVSWTTRRTGGFADADYAALGAVTAPLARIAEIYALRRIAGNLLNAYIGRDAGERILSGSIRRGDIDPIRAVIVMADIRDFTVLSNSLPPGEVTALINGFCDSTIPVIEAVGGEILKLIGDGFLAIFRCEENEAGERRACATALAAAAEIRRNIDHLNAEQARSWPLRYGLSLHLGDVQYGNIGSTTRLDFTTIGPAVNLAARLQSVARDQDRDIILSETVAWRSSLALDDLGCFELKGFESPHRVWAMP